MRMRPPASPPSVSAPRLCIAVARNREQSLNNSSPLRLPPSTCGLAPVIAIHDVQEQPAALLLLLLLRGAEVAEAPARGAARRPCRWVMRQPGACRLSYCRRLAATAPCPNIPNGVCVQDSKEAVIRRMVQDSQVEFKGHVERTTALIEALAKSKAEAEAAASKVRAWGSVDGMNAAELLHRWLRISRPARRQLPPLNPRAGNGRAAGCAAAGRKPAEGAAHDPAHQQVQGRQASGAAGHSAVAGCGCGVGQGFDTGQPKHQLQPGGEFAD